jgi:FMN phosphatase YigB (HAD superfamily)
MGTSRRVAIKSILFDNDGTLLEFHSTQQVRRQVLQDMRAELPSGQASHHSLNREGRLGGRPDAGSGH